MRKLLRVLRVVRVGGGVPGRGRGRSADGGLIRKQPNHCNLIGVLCTVVVVFHCVRTTVVFDLEDTMETSSFKTYAVCNCGGRGWISDKPLRVQVPYLYVHST